MIRVELGDCRDVLATLDADSLDACVTDPPYELGFMGRAWDRSGVAFDPDTWRAVLRVLRPGAHLLAFGGTRTAHRMTCAIEDAGFEVRDTLCWLYGSGFPKSLDVSKAIDRRKDWTALPRFHAAVLAARKRAGISQSEAARRCGLIGPDESLGGGGFMWFESGLRVPTRELFQRLKAALDLDDECDAAFEAAEREVVGQHEAGTSPGGFGEHRFTFNSRDITAAATSAAAAWTGWGTALKPAHEPIILARKPLVGTVAANVLRHGTGAINVDACRVGTETCTNGSAPRAERNGFVKGFVSGTETVTHNHGRWPANVLHDGSDEVEAAFAAFGDKGGGFGTENRAEGTGIYGQFSGDTKGCSVGFGDSGTASRFFKACEHTDTELLICRAKAMLAAWNPDLANTADNHTCLPSEAVASVLSDAATLASQGMRISFPAHSTSATPVELRRISETAIAMILSIGGASSFGLPRESAFPNGCHAKSVDQTKPTGITTITISRWKSDGSAVPVTFSITQESVAPGEAGFAATRFHYSAKATAADRADSRHPTVKPVDLMRWLVRLITPPGGTVLDPFAGSGTTGEAAMLEGFDAILIERDPTHAADIRHRVARWSGLDAPLFAGITP